MGRKVFIGFFVLFLMITSIFSATGCSPALTPKDRFANTGLFGEHKLNRIENFGAVEGSVHGAFFLGIGSISGTVGSEFKLQFYWEPKPGEIVVTTLPYSKFRFIVDNTKEIPTVEFVFSDHYMNNGSYSVEESSKANLNTWTMDDRIMVVAVIKISKATLEKEVYLPKAN